MSLLFVAALPAAAFFKAWYLGADLISCSVYLRLKLIIVSIEIVSASPKNTDKYRTAY